MTDAGSPSAKSPIRIRTPRPEDGPDVWRLIEESPSLDKNSLYCNLLQCSHFAATCAVAELNGVIVGWLSGYVPPARQDTLFVWQVCVGSTALKRGVASKLIGAVLARATCSRVKYLECTITEDNAASWGLFGSVARSLGVQMVQAQQFLKDIHFDGAHDSELAVSIGPFEQEQVAALAA